MLDLSDLLSDPPAPSIPLETIESASALHLMWAQYSCLCGSTFDGPLYHTPFLAKHRHMRKIFQRMYPSGALVFTPVEAPAAYLELPVKLEVHHITIPLCPVCAANRHAVHAPATEKVLMTCDHIDRKEEDSFWKSSLLP